MVYGDMPDSLFSIGLLILFWVGLYIILAFWMHQFLHFEQFTRTERIMMIVGSFLVAILLINL